MKVFNYFFLSIEANKYLGTYLVNLEGLLGW